LDWQLFGAISGEGFTESRQIMRNWIVPVLLFFLLCVCVFADKSRYVFSNQNDGGIYQELESAHPMFGSTLTGHILIDGVTLEPGIKNTSEFWTTGAIELKSTTKALSVSTIQLDEYNDYGDYMQTVHVPGTEFWISVEFFIKNQTPLLSGYQKILARETEPDTYACNFQLVYSLNKAELEKLIPDKNQSGIEVKILILHQGDTISAQSKVLPMETFTDGTKATFYGAD
jgi:hypothetical protein